MGQVLLDPLGRAYIALSVAWTLALIGCMAFLHQHRELPCLRIRRLSLLFVGVLSLHLYGILCMMVYPVGSLFPCAAEFWTMSIILPFGIAMFHATNSQFLHIASRQKQYAHMSSLRDHRAVCQEQAMELANSRWRRILRGVERADRIDRMMVLIGLGMVVQVALALFVFFGSKKFHSSYGLWDWAVSGTEDEIRFKCGRGWEWWLSIVWQFFWAWFYAPYMLWKSRGVRDVHGWRVQTICCCLVGLPASPLWLAGLYAPQMAAVNSYIVPPGWFAISIFFMEVFTIVFPIFQVFKTNALRQETLDAIASWEKRQGLNGTSDSTLAGSEEHSLKSGAYLSSTLETGTKVSARKISIASQKSDMLTMVALENALRTNSDALLQFAALKDFSGENVSFLTHVVDWRRSWLSPKSSTAEHRRKQFIAAVHIYTSFISLDSAEFPINISHREMKDLQHIFEPAALLLVRECSIYSSGSSDSSDTATPFDHPQTDSSSTTDLKTGINLSTLGRANLRSVSRMTVLDHDKALADVVIPDTFTETAFAAAEREIKYLVLTNTWPRFVNAEYASSELELDNQKSGSEDGWVRKLLCAT